jgi:ParB family chromosome partitioning protein
MSAGKKRGLGRGLDALIETAETPASAHELPLAKLRPNELQPRTDFDEELLAALADSIRAHGILQPLLVTPIEDGMFLILAGERRFRAARLAGLTEVPVIVRYEVSETERLELALIENLQRTDLNPIEEAEAYAVLAERFSLSQETIAARVGKSRVAVSNAVRLLRLPDAIRSALRRGELTAGQARPLLAIADAEQQLALAARAIREQLTARQLERLATTPGKKKRKQATPDVNTAAAAETLTRQLQTKVEIRRTAKGGHLRIHFHSESELIRLYDRLLGRHEKEP